MNISQTLKAACLVGSIVCSTSVHSEEGTEFFEAKIRPVLVEHCYECHNSSGKAKAKLVLDYKDGLLKGGSEGPAIVPGKPEESLLLQTIRHDFEDLRMPKNGPRLDKKVLDDFAKWISMGAPDPRDKPPSAEELAETTSWEAVRERRKKWWSFQPIHKQQVPEPADQEWSQHPVDKYLLAAMRKAELTPNKEADALVVLRRLTFAITGLPPTPEQQEAFVKAAQANMQVATEQLVDRLLSTPQYGERWARHWMDWVRYADSHGSEGDPNIPNAYRYRNYLIRALNADVSYDQLVREHLAGDLLPKPRINEELGLNESVVGMANLRFVLHGFAPTDALDEHVRFTDDQIDVVTKTFLGLTVSCARCHDHKFDAISQKDYYALFGILSNGRPAQRVIESPENLKKNQTELIKLKSSIRNELAKAWRKTVDDLAESLQKPPSKKWQDAIGDGNAHNPLRTWARLRNVKQDGFPHAWEAQRKEYQTSQDTLDGRHAGAYRQSWRLGTQKDYAQWSRSGPGMGDKPAPAGSFHLLTSGERILDRIFPSGAYTHLLSNKQNGALSSPRFQFDEGNVWIRAIGDKGTALRYVVWNYPRRGTVYPKGSPDPNQEKWINWNTKYWAGDQGYLEATTNRDHPVEAGGGTRSWFGVTEAVLVSPGQSAPRDEIAEVLSPFFTKGNAPKDTNQLADLYAKVIGNALTAWKKDNATDAQARILSFFVRKGLFATSMKELPKIAQLVTEYRRLENEVVSPRLAPGILDNEPFDQPLFVRGNHKKPGDPVPRRFLEALDATPYPKGTIGRLEYAEDIVSPDNPFATRVIANRIWHHLFGQGIVATTDNFGRLGEKPSHPELLDYLAFKFSEDGWSVKKMIRFLATSKAFRLSSKPSSGASEKDPGNALLSHAHLRRLEAEPIRDAVLAASLKINLGGVAEGGSVGGNTTRRAVYKQVKRNSLDSFLTVFDAPVPATTKGRRDATNVPAQSLTMMNDPFVIGAARDLANNAQGATDAERISHMFKLALGRAASERETIRAEAFIKGATEAEAKQLAEKKAVQDELAEKNRKLSAIVDPVRTEILEERDSGKSEKPVGPKPNLHWDFASGWKDTIRGITAHPKNGAKIENGVLLVSGGGYVVTDALPLNVSEKTLEAWVKLDNLGQRGGGVITIQTPNGTIFDSIVYAEQEGKRWMSGSNGFRRTKSFGGTEEKEADKEFIHLAITYQSDGTITGYRNGRPYGKSYKSGRATFPNGKSVLSFGVRHLPANPQRMLHARIREARVYDRALEPGEVMASFGGSSDYVSQKELIAALSPEQRKEKDLLEQQRDELEKKLQEYQSQGTVTGRGLQDIALALFNMKEFIYLK
tara:strand:- start:14846 stop:18898 length:4053 start_codon:yes stop_codon:yes gene_type:complete